MMYNLDRLSLYVWLGAGGVEKDEGGAGGGVGGVGYLRDQPNDEESCWTVPLCLAGAGGVEKDEGGAGGGGQ